MLDMLCAASRRPSITVNRYSLKICRAPLMRRGRVSTPAAPRYSVTLTIHAWQAASFRPPGRVVRSVRIPCCVPREHLAHRFDQLGLRHRALRLGLFLQMLLAAFFQLGQLGADDQVLDRDLALGLFVGALDDDAGRVALVGVFDLRAELPDCRDKARRGCPPSRSFATMF